MTDDMPTSFKDGEFGHVPAVMLGGPIDGKRYKMPLLPGGTIPHGMGHPIQQPHETSPLAYYERAGETTVGGYHVYFFAGMREPDGRQVHAQSPANSTAASSETPGATERTCDGYGFGQESRERILENGE